MTHLIHSFTWKSWFSSVPGLFPCQILGEEFSFLSKELDFSLLFPLLTFPGQINQLVHPVGCTNYHLLPLSMHIPISLLLHSGFHLPVSHFCWVYLGSFYSLSILALLLSFGWYFSDWTKYPFLLLQAQAGVLHVLDKAVGICLSLNKYRCRYKPKLVFPSRSKSMTINFPFSEEIPFKEQ